MRSKQILQTWFTEDQLELIRNKILNNIKVSESDCWITKMKDYGKIKFFGRNESAHRVSYLAFKGDLPLGMLVCHKCDVRNCVNPDHLFLGTYKDNMQDAITKGRIPTGENNYWRLHPELLKRGGDSWSRKHPERLARGEKNGASKLKQVDIPEIKRMLQSGLNCNEISKVFNVGYSTIYMIKIGKTWNGY
jgi:hypothetical protein